jgi:hypothetical protein
MNKKMRVLGIALILLCVAVTAVFAADDVVIETQPRSVTVRSKTKKTNISRVELCVIYIDQAGQRRETSLVFENVTFTGKTKPFNLGTVLGAYSTFCAVPAPAAN